MAEISQSTFQETVSHYLIRHRSILDVESKLSEATARVNRAIAKSVTTCGCISIDASRQRFPTELSLNEVRELMKSHLGGKLCEKCREVLETEIGMTLFYLAAVCSLFDLDLEEILRKEHARVSSLGVFHLT
jgi:CYTH domain-containing protein